MTEIFASREQVLITAINTGELLDRLARVYGAPVSQVQADIAELGIFVSSVDAELVAEAAQLRAGHYHRERCPVSLADCIAAAHALDRDSQLATSDAALIAVMRAEQGRFLALANSVGVVPK